MGKCILAGHPQAGGQIGYGTYKGDGTATRKISLGVTPKWVLVFGSGYLTFSSAIFGGLALPDSPAQGGYSSGPSLKIVSGGFEVYYISSKEQQTNNPTYSRYNYLYGF